MSHVDRGAGGGKEGKEKITGENMTRGGKKKTFRVEKGGDFGGADRVQRFGGWGGGGIRKGQQSGKKRI